MNVDTGELRALAEQVDALSRKVSALTGRVSRVDRYTTGHVDLLLRCIANMAGIEDTAPRPRKRPARRADRHLRLVDGGKR